MDDDLVEIKMSQQRMGGEMALMKSQTEANHRQNRNDIHQLRNGMQGMTDQLYELKYEVVAVRLHLAKMGGYAAGAGAMVALIVEAINHIWK
jgi:hypothetical protein